jgi:hypothetical protein
MVGVRASHGSTMILVSEPAGFNLRVRECESIGEMDSFLGMGNGYNGRSPANGWASGEGDELWEG